MKLTVQDPPRVFTPRPSIQMKDCARIKLDANEQVTFITPDGAEYDVARTAWGFYATPSLNGRLAKFSLRPVLVKNGADFYFLLLVEKGKEPQFQEYAASEPLTIIFWMDNVDALKALEQRGAPN